MLVSGIDRLPRLETTTDRVIKTGDLVHYGTSVGRVVAQWVDGITRYYRVELQNDSVVDRAVTVTASMLKLLTPTEELNHGSILDILKHPVPISWVEHIFRPIREHSQE